MKSIDCNDKNSSANIVAVLVVYGLVVVVNV
jgi:hypothetical protein